ncbi:MAG: hypothetical protein Q7S27_01500 [Nanoarchaeota archaeon]|nr:hypothetical protein [Nanoarchaeota archaeon]
MIRKNKHKKTIILLIIFLSIILVAGMILNIIPFSSNYNYNEEKKTFCTPQSREAEACIKIYKPVCGWSDPKKVQCIKYPCANTYSNSCLACLDKNTQFWTESPCPA